MVNQIASSSWPKRITVERKIVNLLSRSLYADFPRAIREAVSNSFDADATVVRIQIDLLHKEIIIEDNGVGMSVEKFDNYLRIAGMVCPPKRSPVVMLDWNQKIKGVKHGQEITFARGNYQQVARS